MSKLLSFRTIRTAAIVFAAGAAMSFMSAQASAQSCGYGGGFGGGFVGGYGGYGSGLSINVNRGFYGSGVGVNLYRPSYYRRPVWHDTTHYDYYPGRLVPHGNHFDYVPGHYHLHRTGHWHH